MIIHDIKINYSLTSNERYKSLEKHLKALSTEEALIFTGETFYLMDLYLGSIERFVQFLNQYSYLNIYIQDHEILLNSDLSYTWYSMIEWPEHVRRYTTTSELEEMNPNIDIKKQKRIAYRVEGVKKQKVKKNDINIDGIYAKHEGDLVGLFIKDIRSKAYEPELQNSIIMEGLQYLLRW